VNPRGLPELLLSFGVTRDVSKPGNRLGYGLTGYAKPSRDRREAEAKLLKVKGLARDALVDWWRRRVEQCHLEAHLGSGSNSLRPGPPRSITLNPLHDNAFRAISAVW
jgi:hypothetical protein